MKEFEVSVQVRNNRLKERRDALGFNRAELARKAGVGNSDYGALEALKDSPVSKKTGTWRPIVFKLADFYKVKPDDLFPPAIIEVKKSEASFKADGAELVRLTSFSGRSALEPLHDPELPAIQEETRELVERALKTLTPREENVIRRRFGFDGEEVTLQEAGAGLRNYGSGKRGVTSTRAREIEAKAIRKLRHPKRGLSVLDATKETP